MQGGKIREEFFPQESKGFIHAIPPAPLRSEWKDLEIQELAVSWSIFAPFGMMAVVYVDFSPVV